MKVLGEKQFQQKRFKHLDLCETEFEGLLGKLPQTGFVICAVGDSGNGKTELVLQLSMMLREFGKVGWYSYEQGHDLDLQLAHGRHFNKQYKYPWLPVDPHENVPSSVTLFEDLCNTLSKRNQPKYVIIDSWDESGFTYSEYKILRQKFKKTKGFVIIMKGRKTCTRIKKVCDDIYFNGQVGLYVQDYIARPDKNRFGGRESYVIWEEEAKKRNPAFFAKRVKKKPAPKRKAKPTAQKSEKGDSRLRGNDADAREGNAQPPEPGIR